MNGVEVEIGDNVCIRSDDGQVFVAKIQELYKSLTMKEDPNRAKVLWYFTPHCLPLRIRQKLPDGLNLTGTSNELFLPLDGLERSCFHYIKFTDDLDAETISGKCKVKELNTHEINSNSVKSKEFFVRYKFDEKFNFMPVFTTTKLKEKERKEQTSRTPNRVQTPSKSVVTPSKSTKTHSRQTPSRFSPQKSPCNQSANSRTPSKYGSALQKITKSNTKNRLGEQEENSDCRVSKLKNKREATKSVGRCTPKSQTKSGKTGNKSVKKAMKVDLNNNDNNKSTALKRKASRSIPDQSAIDKKRNKPHKSAVQGIPVSPKLGRYYNKVGKAGGEGGGGQE